MEPTVTICYQLVSCYEVDTSHRDKTGMHFTPAEDDQFIPFDPPVVSKYGPISRASKTIMRSTNPIQVSASLGDHTVSTPSVRKPVPVASPMPTWYSSVQGMSLVCTVHSWLHNACLIIIIVRVNGLLQSVYLC